MKTLALACVGLILSGVAYAQKPIATESGQYRVVVGPAGNEYYDPPLAKGVTEPPKPSEKVMHWAKTITPEAEIIEIKFNGSSDPSEYRIKTRDGDDEFKFYVLSTGDLTWMDRKNNRNQLRESSDEIVPIDSKYSINVNQVPEVFLKKLSNAFPGKEPKNAWFADSLVGPRYLVEIVGRVFYGTPGGMIHCMGKVKDGGLEEVSTDKTLGPGAGLTIEELISKWGDQFNYADAIAKLKVNQPKDNNFRYIVMGDCRDQRPLLDAMVQHIDSLDPKPAFVIISGDAVRHGYADEYDSYFLPAISKTDIPFFVAIGNHDVGMGARADEFRSLFGNDSLNFYFDYGKSRFVFLDNCSITTKWNDNLDLADKWLRSAPKDFHTYVSLHKPPTTIKKWAYHAMSEKDSVPFTDLMTKHQVDEVYCGHIHAYSTDSLDGVNYTLSGGAGASLHDRFGPRGTVHHYVICDSSDEGATQQLVRFYNKDEEK
jgi:hypothetical protein